MSNLTIGVDLGDQYSAVYIVDGAGECVETGRVRTTPAAMTADRSHAETFVMRPAPAIARAVSPAPPRVCPSFPASDARRTAVAGPS